MDLQVAPPPSDQSYKYAWDWFSYHATQRLTTFRFFLIMISAVIIGYFKCLELQRPRFGFVVALFGALIAIAFWILEIRNEELVNCGREALDSLEDRMSLEIRKDDKNRTRLSSALGPVSKMLHCIAGDRIFKHRFWLRLIHGVTFFGFVSAAIYSWRGFRWLW